jgi:predicted Holliday junction resolvase-like endonuclease
MNRITIYLVFIAVIITLIGVVYVLVKDKKSLNREILSLKNALSSARQNVIQLTDYIEKLRKIKKENGKLSDKIKNAKTDEEIYNVIADIISDNNDRVQND